VDDVGDGERFARSGGAQEDLVTVPPRQAFDELLDGLGLVTRGLVGGVQDEVGHEAGGLSNKWERIITWSNAGHL